MPLAGGSRELGYAWRAAALEFASAADVVLFGQRQRSPESGAPGMM